MCWHAEVSNEKDTFFDIVNSGFSKPFSSFSGFLRIPWHINRFLAGKCGLNAHAGHAAAPNG